MGNEGELERRLVDWAVREEIRHEGRLGNEGGLEMGLDWAVRKKKRWD